MLDLANRAQVLELIEMCEIQKDKFTANELDMFYQIKSKYSSADEGSFDDKICLEVMLRNVGIRNSLNMDKTEANHSVDVNKN